MVNHYSVGLQRHFYQLANALTIISRYVWIHKITFVFMLLELKFRNRQEKSKEFEYSCILELENEGK